MGQSPVLEFHCPTQLRGRNLAFCALKSLTRNSFTAAAVERVVVISVLF